LVRRQLEAAGLRCLSSNQKYFGVEVDLLFETSAGERWVVEVKSLRDSNYLERRVTPAQRARIRRVLAQFLERGIPTRAHLALVTKEKVEFIEDFFIRDI
jgi:Holliday junction resolvase-like predicted endonuclease